MGQGGASLIAQLVKNPPAMQETWVQSLGRDDPLENRKATHFSILAWKTPGTQSQVSYSPWDRAKAKTIPSCEFDW